MTREEFQRTGRQMIADARERFRREAFAFCRTDAEREKAIRLETAIGDVSPEEAVFAFRRWLDEQPASVDAVDPPASSTGNLTTRDKESS